MFAGLIRGFRSSSLLYYKKSLYNVLGVSKSATELEIKQAYFSLAKKYHPDVSKDPKSASKFSEISGAYETLGSKEKRKAYDITGKTEDELNNEESEGFYYSSDFYGKGKETDEDFNNFSGFYNKSEDKFVNLDEIFSDFEEFIRDKKKVKKSKADNLRTSVGITFLEAAKGIEKKISLERREVCGTCKGTRSKKGTMKIKCNYCRGVGIVIIDTGFATFHQNCHKCKGVGFKIKSKCTDCKGAGLKTKSITETIKIPAGVSLGHQLKFPGKGHLSSDLQNSGDLLVKISVSPHKVFRRSGCDVHSNIRISLPQSILGGIVEIQTLDGTTNLKIDPGTVSGKVFRMEGQGIANFPISEKKGDAIYTLIVETPKNLNSKQKELFKELAEDNI